MRYVFAFTAVCAAVAVFVFVAKNFYLASVEEEMRETALAALRAAGLGEVEVAFSGGEVRLGGAVTDPAQRGEAREVVARAIPLAPMAGGEEASRGIAVRPTRPPELELRRGEAPGELIVEGALGKDREKTVELLSARLASVEGFGTLVDRTEADETRLLLDEPGSFVSVAAELFRHGGGERVALRGEAIELAGELPHEGVRDLLLELAGEAGSTVEDRLKVAPASPPPRELELEIARNRFGLSMKGLVSGEAVGRRLRDEAAQADLARVADHLAVEPGAAPAAWEDEVEQLLGPLLGIGDGEAELALRDGGLRLAGRLPEEASAALVAAYEPLARRYGWELEVDFDPLGETAEAALAPVPATRLEARYESGLLKVAGVSALAGGGSLLEAPLRERLSDQIPDLLVGEEWSAPEGGAGEGEREGEEAALDALIELFEELLSRAEEFELRFDGGRLRLAGVVAEPADRQILENAAVNAFGPLPEIENELALASEAAAAMPLSEDELAALAEDLGELPVYFAINSDVLDRDGRAQAAAIVERLGEPRSGLSLVVTGMADSVGNPARNRQLSLQRAEAVKRALVEAGWEAEGIELDTQVLNAASIPRSERWKARRVEVSLAD